MISNSLILAFWLAISPPETNYQQSLANLDAAAQSIAEVSPAEAIMKLEPALAAMTQHPTELLGDSTVADKLARARLALVWAYLAEGNTDAATKMMDEAIRSASGRELPISGLGPDVRKFRDQRLSVLEAGGTATIEVDCDACEVLVNEVAASNPTSPMVLGGYRVWTIDPKGKLDPMFTEVALETAGETITLVFRAPVDEPARPEPSTPVDEPSTPTQEPPPELAPKVPRWVKILGMTVGAGLAVTGGVLLSLDGKCKNGDTATSDNFATSCPQVWTTKGPSYALIGVGGGLFMGATVWLAVDEVRSSRSRHANAMIAWTIRF
jgi:hypothetical protein